MWLRGRPKKTPDPVRPRPGWAAGFGGRLEGFLSAHRRWVLALIAVLAVAARVVYFVQANAGPLVQTHQWTDSDMSYYDHWARTILDGDPLCEELWPPFHSWHGVIGAAWLQKNPELRAQLQRAAEQLGPNMTAPRLLWRQWLGPKQFYQEPGYPYLVALTYLLFGREPRWVFLWQMALGVAGALLTHRIAARHFGSAAAAAAGLFAATCSPMLCYELVLLRDCLLVFLTLVLIELTDAAIARRGAGWWALVGAVLGLALSVKAIFNLYLLGLLALLLPNYWGQWRQVMLRGGLVLAGVLAALSPGIARNLAVGVAPFAPAGNAGFGFIQNNAPDYTWGNPNLVSTEYFPEILGRTGGRLLPAMIETLRAHPGVWSVVWMGCCKFDAAWHWWERPDNINSYFYELYAPILGWLPVRFTLISPLALVGLGLGLRQLRRHAVLYLMVLTTLAPMLIFNVLGRFRLPMMAAVIPFAGLTAAQVAAWCGQRRWRRVAASALAAGLLALWTSRPLPPAVSLCRACDFTQTYDCYYRGPVSEAIRGQRWKEAADRLDDFRRREPPGFRTLTTGDRAEEGDEQAIAWILAEVNENCGRLRRLCGQRAEAERCLERAALLRRFAGP